uniref:Uncharacterized protein n=1 Tax=Leersia perrieri TaxID=77586 RepID=A0A0D9WLT0_9ORYZ
MGMERRGGWQRPESMGADRWRWRSDTTSSSPPDRLPHLAQHWIDHLSIELSTISPNRGLHHQMMTLSWNTSFSLAESSASPAAGDISRLAARAAVAIAREGEARPCNKSKGKRQEGQCGEARPLVLTTAGALAAAAR